MDYETEVEKLLENFKDNLISKEEFAEMLEYKGYKPINNKIWRYWRGCRNLYSQFPNSIAYYRLTPENTRYGRNWGEMYILLTDHTHQVKKFRFRNTLLDWGVVATNVKTHELFSPNPCRNSSEIHVTNIKQIIENKLIKFGG